MPCFLQSRPSQREVADILQKSANEDCRYLHRSQANKLAKVRYLSHDLLFLPISTMESGVS